MQRSRKFIIILASAAVVVALSIGGVVLAQENSGGGASQPEVRHVALLERACEIYEENTGTAIDAEELKDAFAQAQGERFAAAMEARLDRMVEEGVLDETEAQELLEWWESRPDVPLAPGFPGHGMQRGFGGSGGFGPPAGELEPPVED